jgi:outer membrane biosynthesis protein TonB
MSAVLQEQVLEQQQTTKPTAPRVNQLLAIPQLPHHRPIPQTLPTNLLQTKNKPKKRPTRSSKIPQPATQLQCLQHPQQKTRPKKPHSSQLAYHQAHHKAYQQILSQVNHRTHQTVHRLTLHHPAQSLAHLQSQLSSRARLLNPQHRRTPVPPLHHQILVHPDLQSLRKLHPI